MKVKLFSSKIAKTTKTYKWLCAVKKDLEQNRVPFF